MNKKISSLYYVAKESVYFNNIVPESRNSWKSNCFWTDIYGKHKHNLPHGFYLGVDKSNLILCYESHYGKPVWIHNNEITKTGRVQELSEIIKLDREQKCLWPFIDEVYRSSVTLVETEDVMANGPDHISEFIIFNLELFT